MSRKVLWFAIRTETLEEMVSDPEWSRRLDAAKTMDQMGELLEAYGKEKGSKIKQVPC